MVPFSAVRLLIDYRPALRERTGVGEFVHELAKALSGRARNGVIPPRPLEVTLFTSSWKDRPAAALAVEMPAARIADVKVPVRGLVWAWNRLEWPPVEWLAGEHDVVHSQSPLLIPASRAAQCVTVHDLDFLRHPEHMTAEIRRDYPALARAHAARADAVIVSSQYAAAEVSRELQLARSRVHVCPPGRPHWAADIARRRGSPDHRGQHILFMGTLSLRKNVGTLLEAYARLRAEVPGAPPLVLAGHRTAASTRWEARCEQPPLKGHVTITGYVNTQQRIDLYADAVMLVLPSYEEGFGLPVLEAMACGVPVIVSSRGSLPEVAGDAATPIDPDDAEGFTARMRALLDARAAAAAADRGLAQASRYSWDACADAALGAYASAMEAHAHRR